jgi:hypothetical protein
VNYANGGGSASAAAGPARAPQRNVPKEICILCVLCGGATALLLCRPVAKRNKKINSEASGNCTTLVDEARWAKH